MNEQEKSSEDGLKTITLPPGVAWRQEEINRLKNEIALNERLIEILNRDINKILYHL